MLEGLVGAVAGGAAFLAFCAGMATLYCALLGLYICVRSYEIITE